MSKLLKQQLEEIIMGFVKRIDKLEEEIKILKQELKQETDKHKHSELYPLSKDFPDQQILDYQAENYNFHYIPNIYGNLLYQSISTIDVK